MATRRLLQAAGRRLGARAASDDARIVLLEFPGVKAINLEKLEYDVGHKAYEIINRKKYTAYGVANATATIVRRPVHKSNRGASRLTG